VSAPARLGALLAALGFVLLAAVVNFWPTGGRDAPAGSPTPTAPAPAAFTAPRTLAPPVGASEGPRRESSAAPTAVPPPREPVLRLASPRPASLDPAFATDAPSLDLALALFEGLVGLDAAGKPYGIEAQSWEVSEDGRTYTFSLRDGLRWSDGEPLTAADYVFAWRRNVAPAFGTPAASSLLPLGNASLIQRGTAPASALDAAAPDALTLVVTLEQPTPYFLRLAATPALFPLPRRVIAAHGRDWATPELLTTNGPFVLADASDAELTLTRSETYWGERPPLETIHVRLFPEGSDAAQLAAFDAGEVDVVHHLAPGGPATPLLGDPRWAGDVRTFDEQSTVFVAVNHRRPILRDRRVRQALGMAVDRQLLLRALGLPGKPTSSLQPAGIAGRTPALWPEEDPAAARALLADAGYPDGRGFPELTFTFNASATWRTLGEHLAARWRDTLGINLRLESLELAAFLRWRTTLESQRGDLYRGGWAGEYTDPANWYNALWDSRADAAQLNSGWRSGTYDALVRRAAVEDDPAARAALYGEAEALLAEDYPAIPLYQTARRALVRPYVQGFALDPAGGALLLRQVRIAGR
jgi:oligopeptide transport system substrate-binding protein